MEKSGVCVLDPIDLVRMSSTTRKLLSDTFSSEDSNTKGLGLHGLNLLVVFSGYLDAGNVATQLENVLLERLEHQRLATFDTDQLLDYRARRPHLRFDGKQFSDYEAPEIELHLIQDQLQRPFLLLSGPEPDYQWDRFVAAAMILIEQLDVQLVTFVDAVPLPVPHTRPIGVTTHGTAKELLEGLATWAPKGRVAAGAAQLLELRAAEAGRRVSGYTLHVPHYLADATYPQAAVAAMEYIGAAMELLLPAEELRESGREVEQQIAAQVENRPEIAAMLQRIEERFDEHAQEHQTRSLLLKPDQDVPDAEEIGSAVESYLSQQTPETETRFEIEKLIQGIQEHRDQPLRPSRSQFDAESLGIPETEDATNDDDDDQTDS